MPGQRKGKLLCLKADLNGETARFGVMAQADSTATREDFSCRASPFVFWKNVIRGVGIFRNLQQIQSWTWAMPKAHAYPSPPEISPPLARPISGRFPAGLQRSRAFRDVCGLTRRC